MSEQFKISQDQVKNLKKRPSDGELLELYAWFKQASVGEVQGERPGMLKIKDRAKWDAWKKASGKNKEDSEKRYCDLVSSLVSKYGVSI